MIRVADVARFSRATCFSATESRHTTWRDSFMSRAERFGVTLVMPRVVEDVLPSFADAEGCRGRFADDAEGCRGRLPSFADAEGCRGRFADDAEGCRGRVANVRAKSRPRADCPYTNYASTFRTKPFHFG